MWYVSSRSGVATSRTAIHLAPTYLLTYLLTGGETSPSFAVSGPVASNTLPETVRDLAQSIIVFHGILKAALFTRAYHHYSTLVIRYSITRGRTQLSLQVQFLPAYLLTAARCVAAYGET